MHYNLNNEGKEEEKGQKERDTAVLFGWRMVSETYILV